MAGASAWRRVSASLLVLRWFCFLAFNGLGTAQPAKAERPPLDYVIVVTGGEILEGLYPDSHTHYLTRVLRPLGGRCVGAVTVDDQAAELSGALRYALGKAPLVIVTGGLGPTPNDITREAIAAFTGIALHEHEEVLAGMERQFHQSREQIRANLRRQARVPVPGSYLPNSAGTAVGLVFPTTNATIVALPGPPRELEPMVERELVPYLRSRFGLREPGMALTLRFVGLGQSQISQTLQEHTQLPPELVVTSQFDAGRVDFTFAFPAGSEIARVWLADLVAIMRRELGDHLYAEDATTLEAQVVHAFARRGLTLALVEIGTGGHVGDSLSQVPGLERVLVGSYVAPTERRLEQLLQVATQGVTADARLGELARGARTRAASDIVVAVRSPDPGEASPSRVRVLWVGTDQQETGLPWSDSSVASNALLTTRVLDWLRRQLAVTESRD